MKIALLKLDLNIVATHFGILRATIEIEDTLFKTKGLCLQIWKGYATDTAGWLL